MQIVAPAGSSSALRAAVYSGADAVYLGLPAFGARAKAQNFSLDTLKSEIDFAHIYGTKVFITLNTLIKDAEMSKALDMAKFAYDCGADAAIVQDIRFIERIKKELPDFQLHASTQMGIHNAYGAKIISDMGLRRAVLSRETLPDDIPKIKETGIEVEFFVQGALCVCFSGNCYFSSLASSYSGNRGKCMQLCRKPYIFHGKRGYFLSAKDLFLYDKLHELEQLGVDAIKIEGRMRSDEYVAQAVSVYKSNMPVDAAKNAMKTVFNRGDYCSAYLDKNAPHNVIYDKSQGNIGISVGKITQVKGKKAAIKGFTANKGDGYKVMRDGVELCGAHESGGEIITEKNCRVGDELRRTLDGSLALSRTVKRLPVSVTVEIVEGEKLKARLSCRDTTIVTEGNAVAEKANSNAITQDDIIRSFGKTSNMPFEPTIEAKTIGKPFIAVAALNELRRTAYSELYNALAKAGSPRRKVFPPFNLNFNRFDGRGTILMVESADVLNSHIIDRVDFIALNPRDYSDFDIPTNIAKPILLNAPITARGDDVRIIKNAISRDGIYGVISNNFYTLGLTDKPILLGTGHNIIGHTELPHISSCESESIDGFAYVYGYAPLMTLCHCPYGKCVNCSGLDVLCDESGRRFTMRRYKTAHCYWQLLNCVPHNLLKDVDYPNKIFDCTGMTTREITDVLSGNRFEPKFTRGNIGRGLK